MTRYALAQGDRVVATLRKPTAIASLRSTYPETQLVVTKLDVTSKDEIKAAFQLAKAAFGRIDFVFNNAGYAVVGCCWPDGPGGRRPASSRQRVIFGS